MVATSVHCWSNGQHSVSSRAEVYSQLTVCVSTRKTFVSIIEAPDPACSHALCDVPMSYVFSTLCKRFRIIWILQFCFSKVFPFASGLFISIFIWNFFKIFRISHDFIEMIAPRVPLVTFTFSLAEAHLSRKYFVSGRKLLWRTGVTLLWECHCFLFRNSCFGWWRAFGYTLNEWYNWRWFEGFNR